ncbi:glycosyltransferase [Mumia sp. DW29H23]|uniref:glycosyltransferase n=1 Tax=Mumia sp. DW29H23 TaxID=3421241 RepID=UPI003D680256
MSTVLAYTSPAKGHLFPLVPVLLTLRDRGHDVHVRTLDALVPELCALGLHADGLHPATSTVEADDYLAPNQRAALRSSVRTFATRARYEAPHVTALVDELAPDVVIADINAWGAMVAAEASGLPWATFSPYTPAIGSKDVPPFGLGLAPARGPLGRLRDRALRPLVIGTAERVALPPLNELRASAGLAPVHDADDLYTRAPLVLVTTAEPFEYPRSDWPEQVSLVGPLDWEPTAEPPAWLDDVHDPMVLVTTSSEYQGDEDLVQVALEALADEQVHVVATCPAGVRRRYDVPPNAHVVEFVPHGAVLDRAVCAVTHGGMGATQKALSCGVPVVAVPWGRDQFEVAQRVVLSGSGVRLPAKRLDAQRLRDAVRAARTMTAGAAGVRDGFAAAGGAERAADAVERLVVADRSRD